MHELCKVGGLALHYRWLNFLEKEGACCGSNQLMSATARKTKPYKWWFEYGRGSPKLREVAMRVFSTCMSGAASALLDPRVVPEQLLCHSQ
eukprot:355638-Chlamydomonas_euryale.AAC.3